MSRQIKDDIDCVPHLHAIYLWVILHFRTLPPINWGIFKIQEVERNPFSTKTFDLFLPRFFRVPVNEPSLPAWLRVVRGMCGADLNIFRLHVPSMYNNATMKKLKNSANILNKFPNFFFNILYL